MCACVRVSVSAPSLPHPSSPPPSLSPAEPFSFSLLCSLCSALSYTLSFLSSWQQPALIFIHLCSSSCPLLPSFLSQGGVALSLGPSERFPALGVSPAQRKKAQAPCDNTHKHHPGHLAPLSLALLPSLWGLCRRTAGTQAQGQGLWAKWRPWPGQSGRKSLAGCSWPTFAPGEDGGEESQNRAFLGWCCARCGSGC